MVLVKYQSTDEMAEMGLQVIIDQAEQPEHKRIPLEHCLQVRFLQIEDGMTMQQGQQHLQLPIVFSICDDQVVVLEDETLVVELREKADDL